MLLFTEKTRMNVKPPTKKHIIVGKVLCMAIRLIILLLLFIVVFICMYRSRRYFQHAHFIPIVVGVGKRGEY